MNPKDNQADLAARAAQGEEIPHRRDIAAEIIGAVCAVGMIGLLFYGAWQIWRLL